MGGHKIINQNALHFLTMTVVAWVKIFDTKENLQILIDSLKFCQSNKGLVINAYVIMSNHIHLICYTREPNNLSITIRDFKRFSANAILANLQSESSMNNRLEILEILKKYGAANRNNSNYQLWYQDNRPIELYSPKWIHQKISYIHNNPVRAGIVESPEEYLLSSARQYQSEEGIFDIEILDFGSLEGYISSH